MSCCGSFSSGIATIALIEESADVWSANSNNALNQSAGSCAVLETSRDAFVAKSMDYLGASD